MVGEETEAQSGKGRKKNAGGSLGSLGGLGRNGVGRKTVKFSDGGKRRRAETGRQKKKKLDKKLDNYDEKCVAQQAAPGHEKEADDGGETTVEGCELG